MTMHSTDADHPSRRAVIGGIAVSLAALPARGMAGQAGAIAVTLEAGTASLKLAGTTETPALGYGGTVPGPVLRLRKGQGLKASLVNRLAEPTSISWHGVRNRNAMDGVAGLTQPPVPPGGRFDYAFTPPDSGTFWYHPEGGRGAAGQVARGLYGVLVVDEADPPAVEQDLLLVIDDWRLDAKGQVTGDRAGPGGSTIVTVNGKPRAEPVTARPGARIRLRLLNVCASRIALVGFSGLAATVIAVDGQPCEIFKPARDTIPIGPGSRFELMLDVPREASSGSVVLRGDGVADLPLMTVAVAGAPLPAKPPVAKLPENPLLPTRIALQTALRRDVVIAPGASGWTIGGQRSDGLPGKPLFSVKRGGIVTLTIVNKTEDAQQMHVHGHVWRLLHDLDDGWDPYWRDSVLLAPGKSKHVAFVADNPGRWALGSSMPSRWEAGMATWFEVK